MRKFRVLLPVVLAITLHEAAHGYIAMLLGDHTAYMLGRVTLNPLKHIDPVGTIAVPGFLIAVSVLTRAPLFIFGVGSFPRHASASVPSALHATTRTSAPGWYDS